MEEAQREKEVRAEYSLFNLFNPRLPSFYLVFKRNLIFGGKILKIFSEKFNNLSTNEILFSSLDLN